jgi:hypothetical protein
MPLSSLFRIRQVRGREIWAMRPAGLDCLTTASLDLAHLLIGERS